MENVNAIEEKKEEVSTTVQYIVVKIGNEQYGINIKYIDNIVRKQDITRVPKTQHYYKGVINLRGEIIPVMSESVNRSEGDEVTNNYISAIGKHGGELISLLDIVSLIVENK